MDVLHFVEFGKLKYIHYTIDTFLSFQWVIVLSSEMTDSVITYQLVVMAVMGIPAKLRLKPVFSKMKQCF